jgi:Tol biopolymer transport system component
MDRETGDTRRVSPGVGKTTCAWIHPDNQHVLFASTQFDPEAQKKQQAEIEFRHSGKTRRYAWDYDEQYELVTCDLKSGEYQRLTNALGYDAEGSYSPDGKWICFASNRRAYSGELTPEEQKLFEVDPSSAIDLYMMKADGSDVRRLTDTPGYDGGPFFSADGRSICWRRFSENGVTAEIMVMDADGKNQRALTHMQAMSWAPFFHPSGDYLVFATNKHGFDNFEIYMVDAAGKHEPVRVTYRKGFDGLPVFTPKGATLAWTSNNGSSQSQIFEAKWNDAAARQLLELGAAAPADQNKTSPTQSRSSDSSAALEALAASAPAIEPSDIGRHVDYLCRPELGGRLTGTEGERKATAYAAAYLESLGLQPAGENGSFFQEFEFVSGVKLGTKNALKVGDQSFEIDKDWRPLFFSEDGHVDPTDVVFAGYGIVAPEGKGQPAYDSYTHLDVQDKWVLVYRFLPQDVSPERRQHLSAYSLLRYKTMVARDRGAKGLIIVSGPTSAVRQQLVPLAMDGTMGTTSLPAISIVDRLASDWFKRAGKDLGELQKELDKGEPMMGFALDDLKVAVDIDIDPVTSRGRNVLALLPAGAGAQARNAQAGHHPHAQPRELVVIGAHIDHLGTGAEGSSLAKEDKQGKVHRGADDNASGVAGMLEIAQYLTSEVKAGRLEPKRDALFAAWSGEELGLRGSQAFCDHFAELYPERAGLLKRPGQAAHAHGEEAHHHAVPDKDPKAKDAAADAGSAQPSDDPHAGLAGPHAGLQPEEDTLYPAVAACLNMDMIGRLREQLVLQGIGSSPYWTGAIERRNAVTGLSLSLQADCNLPTDASSFFRHGVPILSAFTGSHSEYHTPRDTPELLNYEGAAETAKLMALIARDVLLSDEQLPFTEQAVPKTAVASLRAYLGTIPNYTREVKGAALDGVAKGGPAEEAGLKGGDVIVELAGRKIENIYDYTFAIDALKIGQPVKVIVDRNGKQVELQVTPRSRQ